MSTNGNQPNDGADQAYIKRTLKKIKEEKKAGNEKHAQRLADELFVYLGWE
jgi:hypothetical protein